LPLVCPADIEDVVSAWTGVPVERMDEDDKHKLLSLVRSARLNACVCACLGVCLCIYVCVRVH